MARPGIGVTVTYAANGGISELLVSPQTTTLINSRNTTLSRDSVDAVIDELAPGSERGKYLIGGFDNFTCLPTNDCNGSSSDYQKLMIYYNAGTEGRVTYAIVRWKD